MIEIGRLDSKEITFDLPTLVETRLLVQSMSGGGYFNNLGSLRSQGLVDYPSSNHVSLTDSGRQVAGTVEPVEGLRSLHESWLNIVTVPQANILAVLIDIHPEEITKEELADRLGVSSSSGGYANNLGRLRTLGAIDYPGPGRVKATKLLFPEGLR